MRTDRNGLYDKYQVTKRDDPDRKHEDCSFFVLDLTHDPIARAAARAYADWVSAENPVLSAELRRAAKESERMGG